MSHKLTAAVFALVIAGAVLGSAGHAVAGNDGFIWSPFHCKDNPTETQCKVKR